MFYWGSLEQRDAENLQHGVQIHGQFESFAGDGYEQVGTDGDPDLSFDCVLRSTVEGFDPQMLFDPFEEQLDLPAAAVEIGDGLGWKGEVVGDEDQAFGSLGVPVANTAKMSGMSLDRVEPGQRDGLIALHAGALVDRMRQESAKAEVLASACDEECTLQSPAVETLEIEVPRGRSRRRRRARVSVGRGH